MPADPIIDLLREQGELLPDATDGLLRAEVRISDVHVPYVASSGTSVPGATRASETVGYYIEPVNKFLGSTDYLLFNFVREIGNSYPLFLQVFPTELSHPLGLHPWKTPYMTPVINDLNGFTTELTKIFKSKGVTTLLAGMIAVINGSHRKDTTQDRREILGS